jgi:S-formylglutathione hydrolase
MQDFKRQSIFGHSMGGHGALTLYLASETKQYRSASAFAPIANPVNAPWGHKAFAGYLLEGVEEARATYDATELVARHKGPVHVLVDYVRVPLVAWFRFMYARLIAAAHASLQGTADNFYKAGQLLPENFLKAAREAGFDEFQVRVREQEGYDHSYFFVRPSFLPLVFPYMILHADIDIRRGPRPL